MTKISWVLGRVGDLGRRLQRDWTDWIDSFFWGIDMLENLDPVRGQGWSLWGIITGFAYLLHLYRLYGHFTPFAGTYYDRPVYSHHFSLDLGRKQWF